MGIWNQVQLIVRHTAHSFRRKRFSLRFTLAAVLMIIILIVGYHASSSFADYGGLPNPLNTSDGSQSSTDTKELPTEAEQSPSLGSSQSESQATTSRDEHLTEMIKLVMDQIKKHSPDVKLDSEKKSECRIGDIGTTDTDKFDRLTEKELSKCLTIPETVKKELKDQHTKYINALRGETIPKFDENVYEGEGIVIAAGGKFTLMAMPAIKAIRMNANKDIPIEIMIPPEDSEESEFCHNVLPKLDPSGLTKCVFMDKFFDQETLDNVQGYQLKALALLASSFEKALLLDADNYVVNSIEGIFDSDVFHERGLILWPDYWRRLHHPDTYDIVGIDINRDKQIRYSVDDFSPSEIFANIPITEASFHDLEGTLPDGGTESGQLLVDKSKHLDSIILALYYNYNGPKCYYRLLGQGFAGEGDKDTFALAAYALSAKGDQRSFYQVKSPVNAMGHWATQDDEIRLFNDSIQDKQFRGVAMIQHDYVEDYELLRLAQSTRNADFTERLASFEEEWKKEHNDAHDLGDAKIDFYKQYFKNDYSIQSAMEFFRSSKVSFVHSHLPKYEPWSWAESGDMMFDGKKAYKNHKDDKNYTPSGKGHYRMYSDNFNELTNYDLELANFECFRDYICGSSDGYKNFSYLLKQVAKSEDGSEKLEYMCDYIKERVSDLSKSTWSGSVH
ncbi:LAFE_0H17700g1_1 [Lachancea fermentati]|uniref:LAFE_0H17700g1_1 n=1 Tax=Lachancea fermentati TaxID=4955 RepID=A0A1G4ML52_LACFM|nr:LAFE_0H17700g1_1 [Lachancea fermentati]